MTKTTIKLRDGYDRSGRTVLEFRNPSSIAEMVKHCDANGHIWFCSNDGSARRVKVNGRVRTWKRNPNRVEVPVKYGLYEYGTFTEGDIERVLIPV